MDCHNNYNVLLRYDMIFNQYVVDQYARIESERLAFIRSNQTNIRSESYVHLQDALQSYVHRNAIG
jgi:hypothetical protein